MATIQKIEKEVSNLSREELAEFRDWFEEFDAAIWDKQFEEDVRSGKLDKLAEEAIKDFKKGKFKEI
jgi:hypothetical protein